MLGPRMAVDLPGDIVGAAGIGGAGLGEADHGQQLALPPPPRPARAAGGSIRRRLPARPASREAPIALRVGIDDRADAALALGPQLGRIGQREAPPPQVERLGRPALVGLREPSRVGAAAPRRRSRVARAASSAAQTSRDGCANRAQTETLRVSGPLSRRNPPRSAPHIWRPARHARNGKTLGGTSAIGEGQPAAPIGRAIIRDDQVEIEHQPVELLLAQAGAVEQDRPRAAP